MRDRLPSTHDSCQSEGRVASATSRSLLANQQANCLPATLLPSATKGNTRGRERLGGSFTPTYRASESAVADDLDRVIVWRERRDPGRE